MIKKIKLVKFYRTPGMEAQYVLEAVLFHEIRKVFEGNNLVVFVGDFNYPDIKWCNRQYTSTSSNFIYFCEEHVFNQYDEYKSFRMKIN